MPGVRIILHKRRQTCQNVTSHDQQVVLIGQKLVDTNFGVSFSVISITSIDFRYFCPSVISNSFLIVLIQMDTLVSEYFFFKIFMKGRRHSPNGSKIQRMHSNTCNICGPLPELSYTIHVHKNSDKFLPLTQVFSASRCRYQSEHSSFLSPMCVSFSSDSKHITF